MTDTTNRFVNRNFVTDIIDEDLESGRVDRVATRFPPEPNGYLHIGHAKSICLNFGLAKDYKGTCFMRFDDTNPTTEDTEFVESIQNDVKWLGWNWDGETRFASDYFTWMYELAEGLIQDGKAYVDSQSVDEIREQRGSASEPGTPSPYRDRSIEENLDLFRRMRAGEFNDGEHVLRAKIDMSAANILMRDPLLYRIRHAHHHRTGDDWCIYPMYDYAHCLEDAYENITHSICTLEFENNRELYDWVVENTRQDRRPHQYEFARLNLTYTVMSKRKFIKLVDGKYVNGWDDPRLPTIAGLRRRGVRPEAIREFCNRIGLARANSTVDLALFEFCLRDDLNMIVRRVMAVVEPLKVTITNWHEFNGDDNAIDWIPASYFPHDVPQVGERQVPFGKHLYIEQEDFNENPPKDYYRLAPGREVRLRYGYYITCDEVIKDDDGNVIELLCHYDPNSRGGETEDGRNVAGTIHWVSATEGVKAEFRLYDRLFRVPAPGTDENVDFIDELNPDSLTVKHGFIEPSVATEGPGERYQFERQGYFVAEPEDHKPTEQLIYNRIVTLRDSWGKKEKEAELERQAALLAERQRIEEERRAAKEAKKAQKDDSEKRPANYHRIKAREESPELAAKYDKYINELKLSEKDADLLAGDFTDAKFFEAVLDVYSKPEPVAKLIINSVMPLINDSAQSSSYEDLRFTPSQLAKLVELIDTDTITSQSSGIIFERLCECGGDPVEIMEELGLRKMNDDSAVREIVVAQLEAEPDLVQKYHDGTASLVGYFIGKVMKATRGSADGKLVRQLLLEELGKRQ